MQRADALQKTLMLGKIEARRRRGWKRRRWLDDIIDTMDMSLNKLWEIMNRKAWGAAVHGVTKSWHDLATEQQHKFVVGMGIGEDIGLKKKANYALGASRTWFHLESCYLQLLKAPNYIFLFELHLLETSSVQNPGSTSLFSMMWQVQGVIPVGEGLWVWINTWYSAPI